MSEDYLEKITSKLAEYGVPAQVWIGRQNQIQELLSLIANSQLYFGADTGPMHFASRAGYSCIGYLWEGHYARFYPVARSGFIATQALGCFGCGWFCFRERLPACIDFVRLPDVLAGLDRLLDGKIVGVEVHAGSLSKSEGQRQANILSQQERQQERNAFRVEIGRLL